MVENGHLFAPGPSLADTGFRITAVNVSGSIQTRARTEEMMADQNKNQSNQNRQGGQQGSQRKPGSGADETRRTQGQNQDENQDRNQQGQRGRQSQGESIDDETMGESGRSNREPASTANDRGVGNERRNVSGTDREKLDRESGIESETGVESESDIEDEDIGGSNR